MTQISTIVVLAYWLEDAWIGSASAAIFLLLIVVARVLVRIVRRVSGRQIRDVSSEEPWKPSEDFHIENKNNEDDTKSNPQGG